MLYAATWNARVLEAFEHDYLYPCCRHCHDDDHALCCDDHELPCPHCDQPPITAASGGS